MASMEAIVAHAEEALLLVDTSAAEQAAESALKRSIYSKQRSPELQDRAAVVLLQCLNETGRFSSCRKLLCDFFGSLEAAPPTSLLLWLSLSLDDCRSKHEAPQLILKLLQSKQAGGLGGWTHQHYLCLLHLYLFDVLLPELKEVSEVQKWLETAELTISQEERQAFKEELLAQLPAAPAEPLPPPSLAAAGASGSESGKTGPSLPAAVTRTASAEGHEWREQQQQQAKQRQQWDGHAGAVLQYPPGHQSTAREIEEDELSALGANAVQTGGAGAAAAGPGPAGWVGAACQQVKDAAQAACSYVSGSGTGQEGGSGSGNSPAPPLPSAQALAGTVLGAVLLYAVYAEREAIRRRLGRFGRSAWQGLSDLWRMGLSLSPNPMTAPR